MPTDLSKLIVAAESATAEQEIETLWEAYTALFNRLPAATAHDFDLIVRAVLEGQMPRSCLLGAALLLVPEGWTWSVRQSPRGYFEAFLSRQDESGSDRTEAATPALALLAASLRALQAAAR